MTADEIRALRGTLCLSCKAFGELIGLATNANKTVREWESGKARPGPVAVRAMWFLAAAARSYHLIAGENYSEAAKVLKFALGQELTAC